MKKRRENQVRGGLVDVVAKVGQCYIEHPDYGSALKPLQPIVDRLKEADSMIAELSSYPTGEAVEDAYRRTFIANRSDPFNEAPERFAELLSISTEVLRRRLAKDKGFDQVGQVFAAAWPYLGQTLKTFEWMRFCITEQGYMGLCSNATRPGDMVYIVLGLATPFVLRRSDNRQDHPQLVGQCDVHGVMKGEVLDSGKFVSKDLYLW